MNPSTSNSTSAKATKKDSTAVDMKEADVNADSPKADEERSLWCTSKEEGILVASLFAVLLIFVALLTLCGLGIFDNASIADPTTESSTDEPFPTEIPTTTPGPIIKEIPTFKTLIESGKTSNLQCEKVGYSIDIVSASWTAAASPINCTFDVLESVSARCINQTLFPLSGREKGLGTCELWAPIPNEYGNIWLAETYKDSCLKSQENSSWTLQVVHRCINFEELKDKNEYLSKEISNKRSLVLDCGPCLVDVISASWSVPNGNPICFRDVTPIVKDVCIDQDNDPDAINTFRKRDVIFGTNAVDKRCVVWPAENWLEMKYKSSKWQKWPLPLVMCKDFYKKLRVDYKCISTRTGGNKATIKSAGTKKLTCPSKSTAIKILTAIWYIPNQMECRIDAKIAVMQQCREQFNVLKKDVCEISPNHVNLANCKDPLSTNIKCEPKAGFGNCPLETWSVWQLRIVYDCPSS